MLSQLLESSPKRQRRHFSTLVSLVGHAIVLSAAVATARPVVNADDDEKVITLHPPAPPPQPPCGECGSPRRTGGIGEGTSTLPRSLDETLGEIEVDLLGPIDPPGPGVVIPGEEWRRAAGGDRTGAPESAVERTVVDREVLAFATNPVPRYPAELRAARIEGTVLARFVVDTTGRVLMETVIVDTSPHRAFSEAVVDALRRSRFQPAEFRGRKVRQLVSQPFLFVLRD